MIRGSDNAFVTWQDHDGAHASMRVGAFSVAITDLTKAVVFSTSMPSTDYQVFLQPETSVSAQFYPSNFTVDGFMMNLSVGVNASFSYLAVENI